MSPSNPDHSPVSLYNPFLADHFTFQHCLITGEEINPKRDLVRVFPDWLLERFGIREKTITLLSGRKLPYSSVFVPLSPFARDNGMDYLIRQASDLIPAGLEGMKWIKPEKLYQWLVFLFFGILYQEMADAMHNKDARSQFLLQKDKLLRYHILHYILQGVVKKVEFENFDPGSVFAVECHTYPDTRNFDFSVGLNSMTIMLRAGELGIMASLLDNGIQMGFYREYFEELSVKPLHPIQFAELYSKLSYKAWLMKYAFEYGIALPDEDNDSLLLSLRIPEENKEESVFREWDEQAYAAVLFSNVSKFGFSQSDLMLENSQVVTFLHNESGAIQHLDAEGDPIPPETIE